MAVTWAQRCVLWAAVSAAGTAYVVNAYFINDSTCLSHLGAGFLVILGALSSVVAFHISTFPCSETHTLRTLLQQYFVNQVMAITSPFLLHRFKKICRDPREAQEKFLRKLVSRDVDTEYGRRYLSGIRSLQEFRDKHPLTKYDHYQDYFQRLADGEKNVCVATKVDRFGISSGTTGKGKLIPMKYSDNGVGMAVARLAEGPSPVQKVAFLYCRPARKFTKSGLAIAPALFVSEEGYLGKFLTNTFQNSPFSAFQISTDFDATYVHLLFALADKHICVFSAPFASQLYRAFSMLEENQDMFLEDLSSGRINPRLDIDAEIRRSLDAALKPNPARAEELRAEFARGFVGILDRIWPHLNCFVTVEISGYLRKLNATYTKGSRLFTFGYGCTEGLVCWNLWLDGQPPRYVLVPDAVLMEFIPEDLSEEENPKTLFVDEIEIGKRYEIVITTISGFYRYRMGDVIEVVGFYENCPVIQVRYRTGELLNLRSEKVDKLVVDNAIRESLASWPGAKLVDWTCAESPLMHEDDEDGTYDMFYLLFVEFETEVRLSAEQKTEFDKSLRKQHEFYDHYRQVGTICEARVMIVHPGSFKKLQDFIIANSTASYNQFKMPKKLRTKATLDLMMGSVIENAA